MEVLPVIAKKVVILQAKFAGVLIKERLHGKSQGHCNRVMMMRETNNNKRIKIK